MAGVLLDTVVVVSALAILMTVMITGRRVQLGLSDRREARLEGEMRPVAIRLVEEPDPPRGLRALDRRRLAALAAVLDRFARRLTGEARVRIARFFEENGLMVRELAALRSWRAWRRARAAFLLGDMGSPRAAAGLLYALRDSNLDVRCAAARSLGRLGSVEAVEPIVRAMVGGAVPRAIAAEALLEIGKPAVPPLLELTRRDEEEDVRATATQLVGLTGGPEDAAAVAALLSDASAEVRAKAVRALGRLGKREEAAAVRTMLDERLPFLRVAAAHSLGEIGSPDDLPSLLRQARDDDLDPARAAARAAARIDPEATIEAARRPGASVALREVADLASLGLPV